MLSFTTESCAAPSGMLRCRAEPRSPELRDTKLRGVALRGVGLHELDRYRTSPGAVLARAA